MASPQPQPYSSRVLTMVVSLAVLAVVWTVVWASLPTLEELRASKVPPQAAETAPPSPVLDLTIPGVPPADDKASATPSPVVVVNGAEGPKAGTDLGMPSVPLDPRARQIVEMKCDVEVEQVCPQSLPEEERRQCMERRMTHFPLMCQQILQPRLVRWKERSGHAQACVEDVQRLCREIQPGEGRVLQCLQRHAQDVSEPCYRTLPKGSLTYRN